MIKKINTIIIIYAITIFSIQAQNKDFIKIEKLYNSKEYKKCIDKANSTYKKYKKNPTPIYFKAFANFQLYKTATELRKKLYLNNTLTNLNLAVKKDENKKIFDKHKQIISEIHDTSYNFAKKIINNDTETAKKLLKKIMTIYNDTTPEYINLTTPPKKKIKQNLAFLEIQTPVNETDMAGNKQGIWIKKYKNGIVKSEIFYKDNHPAGIYRTYYQNGNLKANMNFNPKGNKASAVLYKKNGSKLAIGYFYNKQKDSLWQYLYNDSIVIAQENYKKGIKNGQQITLSPFSYPNPIEEKFWKNGKMDSTWTRFYPNGNPKIIAHYKNGSREGKYTSYSENKKILVTGNYKNNLPEGEWKYWNDSTKTYTKTIYKKGTAENQNEISEQQNKVLKQIEKMKNKISEPNQRIQNEYGGGNY